MKAFIAFMATVMVAVTVAEGSAHACGYCDGDRIASVYDGAVAADAKRKGLGVAYVGIDGPFGGSARERAAIAKAVEEVPGTVKGSVFISHAPSAARIVFRPSRSDAPTLVGKASVLLKERAGLTLVILRIECDAPKALP